MRVRVYPDGESDRARVYDLLPHDAVEFYCNDMCHGHKRHVDLIVEPMDSEAMDMPHWHDEGRGPVFRMFKMQAVVKWSAVEVDTLNPFAEKVRTR